MSQLPVMGGTNRYDGGYAAARAAEQARRQQLQNQQAARIAATRQPVTLPMTRAPSTDGRAQAGTGGSAAAEAAAEAARQQLQNQQAARIAATRQPVARVPSTDGGYAAARAAEQAGTGGSAAAEAARQHELRMRTAAHADADYSAVRKQTRGLPMSRPGQAEAYEGEQAHARAAYQASQIQAKQAAAEAAASAAANAKAEADRQAARNMPLDESQSARDGSPRNLISRWLMPNPRDAKAEAEGRRWQNELQHSWMLPGSEWADEVRKNAAHEQEDRVNERARQIQLNRIATQWKDLNRDRKNGHWENGELVTDETFNAAAKKIIGAYVQAGGNPDDLADSALQPGNFGAESKSKVQVYAKNIDDMEEFLSEMADIDTPEKVDTIRAKLDKMAQVATQIIGRDSNSMADAEKVRMQILWLPEEAMADVRATVKAYQNALAGVMRSSSAKKWSQNMYGKLEKAAQSANKDDVARLVADAITIYKSTEAELPQDIQSDLQAIQEQYESYMQRMVMAANVDIGVAYDLTRLALNISEKNYNNARKTQGRRFERKVQLPDIDIAKIQGMTKSDQMLKPPVFVAPNLAKRPNMPSKTDKAGANMSGTRRTTVTQTGNYNPFTRRSNTPRIP